MRFPSFPRRAQEARTSRSGLAALALPLLMSLAPPLSAQSNKAAQVSGVAVKVTAEMTGAGVVSSGASCLWELMAAALPLATTGMTTAGTAVERGGIS